MREKVNTGGLKAFDYSNYNPKEMTEAEKKEFMKIYELGKKHQAERDKLRKEREAVHKRRWMFYNAWQAVKPWVISIIVILVIVLIVKKML
jgi:hypothetical protein